MTLVLLFWFMTPPADPAQPIRRVVESGQVIDLVESPSARLQAPARLAPGAPPLLSFRYFEGQQRHRFSGLDLVLDDAGH